MGPGSKKLRYGPFLYSSPGRPHQADGLQIAPAEPIVISPKPPGPVPGFLHRAILLTLLGLAGCQSGAETGAGAYGRCSRLFAGGVVPQTGAVSVVPLCEENDTTVFFATGYGPASQHGAWSAYRLDKAQARELFEQPRPRPALKFRQNPKLAAGGLRQPRHESYTGTGWDRGHLAPNGALAWSVEAQRASFTVSNIAPQSPRMNRNIWRCFETSIREWAVAYGDIHVVVGTLAGPRTIVSERDPDRVAVSVPSHFFAVVYRPAPEPSALAVLVPNEPGHRDIRDFTMTVAGLEAGTGYRFGLPAAVATKELDLTRWPTRVVAREYLGRLPEIDVQCPRAG